VVVTFEIRRAIGTVVDAVTIQQVEHHSLGDSSYSAADILQLLRNPAHYPYLAWAGDIPVGFCWCFETPLTETRRLEIDLLGVLPTYRRQGIATALLRMACNEAKQRGIAAFRGVVAQNNLPSQHAFTRAGLHSNSEPVEMLVYRMKNRKPELLLPDSLTWRVVSKTGDDAVLGRSGEAFTAELLFGTHPVASADCLSVETLVYRGVWIEQIWGEVEDTIILVRGLVAWSAQRALDELGILCSHDALTQPGQYEALWRAGLESWGRFYIFR
jgi:ribosomal protein S18 acetylase RimI-like enzyme